MVTEPLAVDPDLGKIVDCAKMDELPGGWLGRRQDDFDSIPADSGVVAKIVELGVPGEAGSGGTPVRSRVDGGRGELCFGIGRELPGLIDDPGLCMDTYNSSSAIKKVIALRTIRIEEQCSLRRQERTAPRKHIATGEMAYGED